MENSKNSVFHLETTFPLTESTALSHCRQTTMLSNKEQQKQMNTYMKKHLFHFCRIIWVTCLIFVSIGSIVPGNAPFQPVFGNDKLLHAIAYAGLGVPLPLFLEKPRSVIRWAVFLVLWGIALEGVQGFVPNRFPSFGDILANTVGVAVGITVGLGIKKWLFRSSSS